MSIDQQKAMFLAGTAGYKLDRWRRKGPPGKGVGAGSSIGQKGDGEHAHPPGAPIKSPKPRVLGLVTQMGPEGHPAPQPIKKGTFGKSLGYMQRR